MDVSLLLVGLALLVFAYPAALVAGDGLLQASILGLLDVARLEGPGEIAEGELMRFLAESCWYPTALLPGHGVEWEPVDDRHAHATLVDGDARVKLRFEIDEKGRVASVYSEARGRTVEGESVPTPWQGRFWDWRHSHGMRVPFRAEVAWILPDGPRPYWRGEIVDLRYELADAGSAPHDSRGAR